MANVMNILAGVLSFTVSSALTYGTFNPMMELLSYFPTPVYVLCAVMYVALMFTGIAILPIIMFVSDDKGV